jgi:hypothetical protein
MTLLGAEAVEVSPHLEENGRLALLEYYLGGLSDGLLHYRLATTCLSAGRAAVPDFLKGGALRYLYFGVKSVRAVSTGNGKKTSSCLCCILLCACRTP